MLNESGSLFDGLRDPWLKVGERQASELLSDGVRCKKPAPLASSRCCNELRSSSKCSASTLCLLDLRAPSLSSMSCVNGVPLLDSFNGGPFQPCPFCVRRYNSCRPATSCACCCSSISTYLKPLVLESSIKMTGNSPLWIHLVVGLFALPKYANSVI